MAPAPDYLSLVGGIGITPMIPMIDQAIRLGVTWKLIYVGRSRKSMAFLDDLPYEAENGSVRVHPTDEFGRLNIPFACSAVLPTTAVYVCGPQG